MDNQREISKELFDKSGLESTPNNWHIWKRAFDLGVSKAKESDLLHNVSKNAVELKCKGCNCELPKGMKTRCYECYDKIYFP